MNKKGIVFTLLTIALIGLFLASYSMYSVVNDKSSINTRIKTMNDFVDGSQKSLEKELYVSGFRAILVLQNYTINTKKYAKDSVFKINESIITLMNSGKFDVTGQDSSLMINSTMGYIKLSLNKYAQKTNLRIVINNTSLNAYQEDPWHLTIKLIANISINDTESLASWEMKNKEIVTKIPIKYFIDPVYIVEAQSQENIVETMINYFNKSDLSDLDYHFNSSWYIDHTDAPSFLQRLVGNLTQDPNGIESLVYNDYPNLDETLSRVDHQYFNGNISTYTCPSGIKLAQIGTEHSDLYCP